MYRLLFCIFIVIIYLGCGEKQQAEQTIEIQKTIIKFVLNEGKKWQMDEHTRKTITNLDSILNSQEQPTSIEEYSQLGEKLDEELILLIRGCTMEGPAHDQLHIFLGYFYPMVQDLKKDTEVESSKKILAKMDNLFVEYHKYFE